MPRASAISVFRIAALLAILAAGAIGRPSVAQSQHGGSGDLGRLEAELAAGNLAGAAEIARAAAQTLSPGQDAAASWTIPLARLARAMQQAGELASAKEFYKQSLLVSSGSTAVNSDKVVSIRLAAAGLMLQTGELESAIEAIEPVLSGPHESTDSQQRLAIRMVKMIGSNGLASRQADVAESAYALWMKHARDEERPIAMLGHAWSATIRGSEYQVAATRLAEFVRQYPEHSDTPGAVLTCIRCVQQAHREVSAQTVPEPVAQWLLASAARGETAEFDLNMTSVAIQLAAEQHDSAAWQHLLRRLAAEDQSGQATSDVLASLVAAGRESDAERLAASLIAPNGQLTAEPLARESACRWAGRTLRWSMLAMAAEGVEADGQDSDRTLAIDRLFAEALLQTGRARESLSWWNHIVDYHDDVDFATLIRCAELETAVGADSELAHDRIAAARDSAEDDPFRISLVDLLDAELAIRRLQFDRARALLENVVRSEESEGQLRGRAQWLIGETHFLQRDFASAIDAYRRVEGICPDGPWASAALVQAGKSFEQLGRTREAAVCYGNLLGRFSETAHAAVARRRLAAISPENHADTETPNDAIIRR